MSLLRSIMFIALLTSLSIATVIAASAPDAQRLIEDGQIDKAIALYQQLLEQDPSSIDLRLAYASALTRDRQWLEAQEQYRTVLQNDPNNGEAQRSIATLYKWMGDTNAAATEYKKATAMNQQDLSAQLGLASTHAMDHDFAAADQIYKDLQQQKPGNKEVTNAYYDFKRLEAPRVFVYYEEGLSSKTTEYGVGVPFMNRQELGVEHQDEVRTDIYTRTDNRFSLTHHFGFNHSLMYRYRGAEFDYDQTPGAYAAIDEFAEHRIDYTFPITPQHIGRLIYNYRPTTLVNIAGSTSNQVGDEFDSNKIEARVRSYWSPRFNTTLGYGWLRDLPEEATNAADLKTNDLIYLAAESQLNPVLQISGKYITNPDLDNSIDATLILQGDISLASGKSLLVRFKSDDYKTSDDETSLYGGVRIVPNAHLWSELGLKYASRGNDNDLFPLLSVVYRF